MAADSCTTSSLQRCQDYIKWKRSPIVRLHDWAAQNHWGWWAHSTNFFLRTYFRTLWTIKRLCAKKRAPCSLTPDEKIIVGLMLVGQYERYPQHG